MAPGLVSRAWYRGAGTARVAVLDCLGAVHGFVRHDGGLVAVIGTRARGAVLGMARLAVGTAGLAAALDLDGTEAGGGRLTGLLLRSCLCGSVLLLLCGVLAFVGGRAVAVMTGVAAATCLPLFLYRVAPPSVLWMSDAPASVVTGQVLTYDLQGAAGLVALCALALAQLWPRRQR